ncbi:MAG: extracellular solute-binding protein [Bifidobacteriaceae bacterium]|nr:extracellular solute-binding protein [Bifidobacteriaceae bacterium]MCI1978948.1 extracellular solute-binding protein [Bifidobacteriaceae bacterium]
MRGTLRNKIVRFVAVIVAGGTLLGTTACGSTPAGAASGSGATVWSLNDSTWSSVKETFVEWNKDHPNEQIKNEEFANDAYKEKIRSAIGSGNGPTLVLSWGGSPVTDYVSNKNVVDLTSDLNSVVKSKVLDVVAAEGYRDGKLYAVPVGQVQPAILWTNKAVLKEAGISAAPTTWDELLQDVAKLKAAGKTPISLAGGSKWPYLMWAAYLIDRIGGPDVMKDILAGKTNAWSNAAVIEAMAKIQQLVDAGAFGDSYTSMTADDKADTALLANGQAGFDLMGTWVYADFASINASFAKNDLGFAAFPKVEGGKGDPTMLTGNLANYWSVASSASKTSRATAVSYLKSNTYSDSIVKGLLSSGGVPPVKGIENEIKSADDGTGFLTYVYNAVKKASSYQLSLDVALPSAQGQALLNNLEQVFLKQITPKQFAEAMNKTLE